MVNSKAIKDRIKAIENRDNEITAWAYRHYEMECQLWGEECFEGFVMPKKVKSVSDFAKLLNEYKFRHWE